MTTYTVPLYVYPYTSFGLLRPVIGSKLEPLSLPSLEGKVKVLVLLVLYIQPVRGMREHNTGGVILTPPVPVP